MIILNSIDTKNEFLCHHNKWFFNTINLQSTWKLWWLSTLTLYITPYTKQKLHFVLYLKVWLSQQFYISQNSQYNIFHIIDIQ